MQQIILLLWIVIFTNKIHSVEFNVFGSLHHRNEFGCNTPVILQCIFDPKRPLVVWYIGQPVTSTTPIAAQCFGSTCSINPIVSDFYDFSHDGNSGESNMTIKNVTLAEDGMQYKFYDLNTSLTFDSVVQVPPVEETTKITSTYMSGTTQVMVTTGCVTPRTADLITFNWFIIQEDGKTEAYGQAISEPTRDESPCQIYSDCIQNGSVTLSNNFNITEDPNAPKVYFQVQIVLGGKTLFAVKTSSTFQPQKCLTWKYGFDCANDCTCNITNAISCDPVSGKCNCKAGWSGVTCDDDIDECLEETSCPNKSVCENSHGSYFCKCNSGYFKTSSGICEECDPRHYGQSCQMECTCEVENTHDCDHETGDCICKEGWTGGTCTEDIVECETSPSICQDKFNSTCKNNLGSYSCVCDTGFVEANDKCVACEKWHYGTQCEKGCLCIHENTETCNHVTGNCSCKTGWRGIDCSKDIDECSDNASVCFVKANSTCHNTNGSYSCDCDDGFLAQGDICTDCDLWKYGKNCDQNCTCVTSKSQYCDPVDGSCTCNQGWNGTNCEQDIDECEIIDICSDNSSCNNTVGSYNCECNDGYYKNANEKCQVRGQTQRPVNWSLVMGLSAAGLFLLITTVVLFVVLWRFLVRPSKMHHSDYSRRREDDEAYGVYWTGRRQRGGLDFVGKTTPTWKSNLSRMWMPRTQ